MIMKRIDPFHAKTGFVPMDVEGNVVPDVVKEFDKEAVVEDSSGDDDYAIDHYASDKEEAEDDGN